MLRRRAGGHVAAANQSLCRSPHAQLVSRSTCFELLHAQADEYQRREVNEVELYVMVMRFIRWAAWVRCRSGGNPAMLPAVQALM